MKLPGLIDLSLLMILASSSKGQGWYVNVTTPISVSSGSDAIIQCTFTYPPKHKTENIQVYWKKPGKNSFHINDQDTNSFIYHKNDSFVLEKYKQRTKLTGDKDKGDCSLKISNVTENEPNIYVRVVAKGDQYSFKKKFVSISVSGVMLVTYQPDITSTPYSTLETSTLYATQEAPKPPYAAIFVPISALLIIIFVAGIFLFIKRKRSKSLIRENSGYYVNFSRAPLSQANRELSNKNQDNKKFSEPKATDEPVYINVQAIPEQMDQNTDHTDSIYANVDCSK